MPVKCHFLGWDAPITTKVRDFLVGTRHAVPLHSGSADLSKDLVVAPTHQSGRRLRESLAIYCSAQETDLLPPRVVTPVYFLRPDDETASVASQTEVAAIWAEALTEIDLAQFTSFFPAKILQKDFTWALHTGEMIQQLRDTLSDGSYQIADIFRDYGDILEEIGRWQDLAKLESVYLERLQELGLHDPCELMIKQAESPKMPKGIKRIVIAAVPDPTPLMIQALRNLAKQVTIEILIHAPESLSDHFDEWGRPLADKWHNFQIDIPDPKVNVILAGSPASQSSKTLQMIASGKDHFGPADIAIGVPDSSVIPLLSSDLEDKGLIPFDPSGKAVKDHPIYQLLAAYRALVSEGSYATFSLFLRNADILDCLQKEHSILPLPLLEELDKFQNNHLPMAWQDIETQVNRQEFENLEKAFVFVQDQAQNFQNSAFDDAVRSLLQTVYQVRMVNPQNINDEEFITVAKSIDTTLRELASEFFISIGLEKKNSLELLLRILGKQRYYQEPGNAIIDLEGWLELPWNDAPFLIVTGMNDGFVPDSQLSDVFLPDSLRKQLNLRHDADRLAADTFLMCGFIESRRENGHACFIAGKTSSAGDPLKPSRLLFHCSDEELPQRAKRLFGDAEENRDNHPATISFQLIPPDVPRERMNLKKLSVTAFKDYLTCPFRFYLKHVLGMEEMDDLKTEMDALDFGLMVHDALHKMAENDLMRQCNDEHKIKHFLHTQAGIWVEQRFGKTPPLPVHIQLDAATQRLAAAAQVQAQLISEGWQILHSEMRFESALNGIVISGRIDRIDRHRETGQIRILDYKTTDRATIPEIAHLGSASPDARDYARIFINDKEKRWIDLQLPLYRMLLSDKGEFQGPVQLGYFNLPKATSETDVVIWDSFNDKQQKSAGNCIEGITEDIRNFRFWPPSTKVKYDNFDSLFHGDVADCINVTRFLESIGQ